MSGAHDHAGHHHGHGHAHAGHAHARPSSSRAFAISVALNGAFVVAGVVAGVLAHSMALVADAAHNFGDVLGLALAWGAARLAKRSPTARRTYGLRRTTVLAALANAVILLVGVGGVAWEAIHRLAAPTPVEGRIVLVVAAAGVIVNAGSAMLFLRGQKEDVNVRGAFLHLAGDAAVSLGVVGAGAVIMTTGWTWLDPVVSLVVSVVILIGTWGLLRDSVNLALDAVPDGIEPAEVRKVLAAIEGVVEVHDLHIWAMSTTENALTVHLVMKGETCHPAFFTDVTAMLRERFRIDHATVQVEAPDAPAPCASC